MASTTLGSFTIVTAPWHLGIYRGLGKSRITFACISLNVWNKSRSDRAAFSGSVTRAYTIGPIIVGQCDVNTAHGR